MARTDTDSAATIATQDHCEFCFQVLEAHLRQDPLPKPSFEDAVWCGGMPGGLVSP